MMDFNNIKFKDDANSIVEDLIKAINRYNEDLDESHQAALMLTSFGQSLTIQIIDIGYTGSKLVKFKGFLVENGSPVELLQHVSQLNFLLVSIPREDTSEPKRLIGFTKE